MTVRINYNEPAWGIDLISEINLFCQSRNRSIVRAGGEVTISGATKKLFPDVLLFGDKQGAVVLQGWELKMPDTSVEDKELLNNAEEKANRLNLESFLVWNVNEAVLYKRDSNARYVELKRWPSLGISRRQEVQDRKDDWLKLLFTILDDLNSLFEFGQIKGAAPDIVINDSIFIDFLTYYGPLISEEIRTACMFNALLDAELSLWWLDNAIEHPNCSKYQGIARVNIINWINRFIFAHYLRRYYKVANHVSKITSGTTVSQAIEIFEEITSSCDFMNIFKPAIGQEYIDNRTWEALVNLNLFLLDLKAESISQESFHKVIDNALTYSRKKIAGQYSTPKQLADLLVRLTIFDRTKPVIDPCCGTGTVARAAYELKQSVGMSISDSLSTIWASDKFAFPLQLCSIALSNPLGMGEIIKVFKNDALELYAGQEIKFIHPQDGSQTDLILPEMHAVVSNLPFVRFEEIKHLNPKIAEVKLKNENNLAEQIELDKRTDLYAYLILKLSNLINKNGRIGVITSNSWLASEWGSTFKKYLLEFFIIEKIVISGEGRWFKEPDVVTVILILQKKTEADHQKKEIEFCTLTEKIEFWENEPNNIELLASSILSKRQSGRGYRKNSYTPEQIEKLDTLGLKWNAYFTDVTWLGKFERTLTPANSFFDIGRGERRGWNALFYPRRDHQIEKEYIKPVLLSSADLPGLIAKADNEAFCCSDSVEELIQKNRIGALTWIEHFEKQTNTVGKPLPEVLRMADMYWYEMGANTLADIVVTVNPDKRLAFHRFYERSFVDQRLIRFTSKIPEGDLPLCHALLNSVISLFLLEAAGFGRGLGALDINAKKIKNNFHMIDYNLLPQHSRNDILTAFEPLLGRDIYDLTDELQDRDRIVFDNTILSALGLSSTREMIYKSLLELFYIRQTATSK